MGRARAARARQAQHRHGQGPVHRRRDDRRCCKRLDAEESDEPWLTVCSFLNPHDDSLFGVIALTQGLRYHPSEVPHIAQAPTHEEDLSTKPSCQQSYVDTWGKILAPQPWIETHLKFYYQLQATVDEQITRVLDALAASDAYENTIVIFTSDHGDMQGAHGGMHEKWHVAYEEALRVPFVVSSPLLPGGARELDIPTNHADLIPTLLGLAGIDHDEALAKLAGRPHRRAPAGRARPLRRDPRRRARGALGAGPLHDRRRDQRGQHDAGAARSSASPRIARVYATVKQPNHLETVIAEVEVDGEQHLVKFSRYHDNQQFWTVPGERDERLRGRKTITVTEPEPDEYELYDLTARPVSRSATSRTPATPTTAPAPPADDARAARRAARSANASPRPAGEVPGYRPPAVD